MDSHCDQYIGLTPPSRAIDATDLDRLALREIAASAGGVALAQAA
jgi:hypothetical protein